MSKLLDFSLFMPACQRFPQFSFHCVIICKSHLESLPCPGRFQFSSSADGHGYVEFSQVPQMSHIPPEIHRLVERPLQVRSAWHLVDQIPWKENFMSMSFKDTKYQPEYKIKYQKVNRFANETVALPFLIILLCPAILSWATKCSKTVYIKLVAVS